MYFKVGRTSEEIDCRFVAAAIANAVLNLRSFVPIRPCAAERTASAGGALTIIAAKFGPTRSIGRSCAIARRNGATIIPPTTRITANIILKRWLATVAGSCGGISGGES